MKSSNYNTYNDSNNSDSIYNTSTEDREQFNSQMTDYVIDTIALWDHIHTEMFHLFSNPNIMKIGHGVIADISALYRDFGIIVKPIFDIQHGMNTIHRFEFETQKSTSKNTTESFPCLLSLPDLLDVLNIQGSHDVKDMVIEIESLPQEENDLKTGKVNNIMSMYSVLYVIMDCIYMLYIYICMSLCIYIYCK
jgi:hypothetical protein